jgi:hypothetical protein
MHTRGIYVGLRVEEVFGMKSARNVIADRFVAFFSGQSFAKACDQCIVIT